MAILRAETCCPGKAEELFEEYAKLLDAKAATADAVGYRRPRSEGEIYREIAAEIRSIKFEAEKSDE